MLTAAPDRNRAALAAILVAMLIGLALRLHGLSSIELEYDEGATGYFAALPLAELWTGPAWLEPNPPLFYTLAALVNRLGGSIEQIRLVSVIAGVLSVAAAGALAWRMAGRFAGVAAALLLATSARDILMSQYARGYQLISLAFLLATLGLLLAREVPTARGRQASWALYTVAALAALYTHNIAPFVLLAINGAMLVSLVAEPHGRAAFLRGWLIANVIVALGYAPWVPVLVYQSAKPLSLSWIKTPYINDLMRQMRTMLGQPALESGQPLINMLFIGAVWLALWRLRREASRALLLAGAILGAPGLMFTVSRLLRPLMNGKTLTWVGPFGLVAAGIGCSSLGRIRYVAISALLGLQIAGSAATMSTHHDIYRPIVATLQAQMQPGDTIYISTRGNILLLEHYGWPTKDFDVVGFDQDAEPWFRNSPGRILPLSDIAADALKHKRVWFVTRYSSEEQHSIGLAISPQMPRVLDENMIGGMEVSLYAKP
jgi:hypothetical protein